MWSTDWESRFPDKKSPHFGECKQCGVCHSSEHHHPSVPRYSENEWDGWKKGRETWDREWQPEFSHRLLLTFSRLHLPSVNSLMEAEEEGSTFGGKMPRSRMRAGGRGRRQHPGRTFVVLFPAALAPLLHGLHKSLSAAFSRGIPTFSQGCAQLAMTPALCQMTQSSAIASLICPFPGLWYFSSPVHVCHPLWCLLSRSLCGLSRWMRGGWILNQTSVLSSCRLRGTTNGYTSSLLIMNQVIVFNLRI